MFSSDIQRGPRLDDAHLALFTTIQSYNPCQNFPILLTHSISEELLVYHQSCPKKMNYEPKIAEIRQPSHTRQLVCCAHHVCRGCCQIQLNSSYQPWIYIFRALFIFWEYFQINRFSPQVFSLKSKVWTKAPKMPFGHQPPPP